MTGSDPVKLPVAKTAGHRMSQLCTIPGKAVLTTGSSLPGSHRLSPTQQSSGLTVKSPGKCLGQNSNIIYIIDWNCRKNIGNKQGLHLRKLDSMGEKGIHSIGSSLCKHLSESLVFQWKLLCPYRRNVSCFFWEFCMSMSSIWGGLGTKPKKRWSWLQWLSPPRIFITQCWQKGHG